MTKYEGMMEDIPSFVHILANPSYEPVARRVPSLCWMKRQQACYSSVLRCTVHLPHDESRRGEMKTDDQEPTFQSSEVTSLLLGTSCPPSRIQWRSTSWVELELLFSFRFQILAVESPELYRIPTQQERVKRLFEYKLVSNGS